MIKKICLVLLLVVSATTLAEQNPLFERFKEAIDEADVHKVGLLMRNLKVFVYTDQEKADLYKQLIAHTKPLCEERAASIKIFNNKWDAIDLFAGLPFALGGTMGFLTSLFALDYSSVFSWTMRYATLLAMVMGWTRVISGARCSHQQEKLVNTKAILQLFTVSTASKNAPATATK